MQNEEVLAWATIGKSCGPFWEFRDYSTSTGMILNGLKHGDDLIWFVFLKQISLAPQGAREGVGRSRWELVDGSSDNREVDKLYGETELTGLWEWLDGGWKYEREGILSWMMYKKLGRWWMSYIKNTVGGVSLRGYGHRFSFRDFHKAVGEYSSKC